MTIRRTKRMSTLGIRIPADLKRALERFCRRKDPPQEPSVYVREFLLERQAELLPAPKPEQP